MSGNNDKDKPRRRRIVPPSGKRERAIVPEVVMGENYYFEEEKPREKSVLRRRRRVIFDPYSGSNSDSSDDEVSSEDKELLQSDEDMGSSESMMDEENHLPALAGNDDDDFVSPDLSPQEILLIKIFSHLREEADSKYVAFMKAGYSGNKKKCDNLFDQERIRSGILTYKNRKNIIACDRDLYSFNDIRRSLATLNEQLTCNLEDAISKGMSIRGACRLLDLDHDVYALWMIKGRKMIEENNFNHPFAKFYYRMERAKPKGELNLLNCIHEAATGAGNTEYRKEIIRSGDAEPIEKVSIVKRRQWQAAAWILERTRGQRYGKDSTESRMVNVTPEQEAKEMMVALDMLIATKNGNGSSSGSKEAAADEES